MQHGVSYLISVTPPAWTGRRIKRDLQVAVCIPYCSLRQLPTERPSVDRTERLWSVLRFWQFSQQTIQANECTLSTPSYELSFGALYPPSATPSVSMLVYPIEEFGFPSTFHVKLILTTRSCSSPLPKSFLRPKTAKPIQPTPI